MRILKLEVNPMKKMTLLLAAFVLMSALPVLRAADNATTSASAATDAKPAKKMHRKHKDKKAGKPAETPAATTPAGK